MNEGITAGSGNVFDDLGLPESTEKKVKVQLGVAINRAIRDRNLKQAEAAVVLETEQPEVSALANYKLSGFSVWRLVEFLNALERDVDLNKRLRRTHDAE